MPLCCSCTLSAGLAAEHLSGRAAFGLTGAACAAALAVTAAAPMARMPFRSRMKRRAKAAESTGSSLVTAEELGHDVIDTPRARASALRLQELREPPAAGTV
jgi:hypothetical protein